MYSFKRADVEKDFYMPSSKICDMNPAFDADYQKNCVILLGKLKFLFGEPTRTDENIEQQYDYFITAADEKGDSLTLNIYSGSSGPSIGGLDDSNSQVAADELAEYIKQAKDTVDYEYEGYYLDGPSKIRQGIKNGTPYYEEEELSMEEVEKLLPQ